MIVVIQPSILKGKIYAPASKSSMQRACAASLLSNGTTIIHNPGHSNDDKAALEVIKILGAQVEAIEDGSLKITGNGVKPIANSVNCGESGLGIRMFAPIVALSNEKITIEGEGSLLTRPMDFFDEVLPQLDVKVESNHGKLPLKIKGSLQPKDIEIDGSLSSQFLTGLLMAYAASDARGVGLKVKNLKSKPYVDLTLKVMRDFGLKVPENREYKEFFFGVKSANNSNNSSINREYTVEGDWSGGAFLLVAGAIAGDVVIKGLDIHSTQADKAILDAMKDAGVKMNIEANEIKIQQGPLNAFRFDATDCPDLFPPLVALASFCEGTTVITGAGRLTHKESNRGLTLQDEFGKMGVKIELQGDQMIIKGNKKVFAAKVHSRHDHRIAMACAVAALRSTGEVSIEEAQAIDKSYPDFFVHLKSLGASVSDQYLSVDSH
ncbi:MAG: 3-phosphoshikimate 1-carboxyvinyltransferase [Bacteroidetes bacterium]|nr:3-phosphoshikimate 1-carboxyvinyltransferase [Bacteroidota bacterium]